MKQRWLELMRSAFKSLLNLSEGIMTFLHFLLLNIYSCLTVLCHFSFITSLSMNSFLGNPKVDACVIMLAVTVFINSAPPQTVIGNSDIFSRTCRLFRSCLNNEVNKVIFLNTSFF